MDGEPVWLTFEDVAAIHDEQIASLGGLAGVKDANLAHSAVAAPINLYLYSGEENLLALAIKLCIALAKNHPFLDGNKRTATVSMGEFLAANGYEIFIPDDEQDIPLLGRWVEQVVSGDLSSVQLYDRLKHFIQRQSRD